MLSKHICLVLFISCCLVNAVKTTDTCLAKKESGIMLSMQQSLKTLAKDMSQLETSLKGKSPVQYGCQKGWKRFGDFCYYFSNDKTTWFLGERYCRAHGSSLVDVTDNAENEWLKSKLTDAPGYWLGGSDMKKHQWLWNVNFKPLTYTKWNSGEPNGSGAQCIHMNGKYHNKDGLWNDHSCDSKIKYVCKKKLKCECKGQKGNRG